MTRRRKRRRRRKKCIQCGEWFTYEHKGRPRSYCSEECRKEAQRERVRKYNHEHKDEIKHKRAYNNQEYRYAVKVNKSAKKLDRLQLRRKQLENILFDKRKIQLKQWKGDKEHVREVKEYLRSLNLVTTQLRSKIWYRLHDLDFEYRYYWYQPVELPDPNKFKTS